MNVLLRECTSMSFLGVPIAGPRATPKNHLGGLVGASVGALGRSLVAQMVSLGCFWRVLGDLGAISVDLTSNFVVLRSILVDLGSILIDFGSNLVPLKVDVSAFPMLFRSSGASRSQKSRTSFRLGMGESK